MNMFTEIQYLFCSKENENMLHSLRMEKLREIIDKSTKETFEHGVKVGMLEAKKEIEKLINNKQ